MGKFIKKQETVIKPNGEKTITKYNLHGDILLESFPNGNIHRYAYIYDIHGNKIYQKNCTTGKEYHFEYEYDKSGNIIKFTDRDRNIYVDRMYDDDGNIMYEYHSVSDIASWFDSHGNEICRKDGDIYMHMYYRYDDHGNVLYETDCSTYHIHNTFKYNDHGDLVYMKRESDDGHIEICEYEHEYDDNGNKISTTLITEDGTRLIQYAYTYYDNHNIRIMISNPLTPHTIVDEYDENGNKTRCIMNDGTDIYTEYRSIEEEINNDYIENVE